MASQRSLHVSEIFTFHGEGGKGQAAAILCGIIPDVKICVRRIGAFPNTVRGDEGCIFLVYLYTVFYGLQWVATASSAGRVRWSVCGGASRGGGVRWVVSCGMVLRVCERVTRLYVREGLKRLPGTSYGKSAPFMSIWHQALNKSPIDPDKLQIVILHMYIIINV